MPHYTKKQTTFQLSRSKDFHLASMFKSAKITCERTKIDKYDIKLVYYDIANQIQFRLYKELMKVKNSITGLETNPARNSKRIIVALNHCNFRSMCLCSKSLTISDVQ